jgi:hypothetical protein
MSASEHSSKNGCGGFTKPAKGAYDLSSHGQIDRVRDNTDESQGVFNVAHGVCSRCARILIPIHIDVANSRRHSGASASSINSTSSTFNKKRRAPAHREFFAQCAVDRYNMFTTTLTLIVLAADPVNTYPAQWTTTNTTLELTLASVALLDVMSTRSFLDRGTGYERNPILGKHPGAARLYLMAGAGLLAHTLIAYLLPEPYRQAWQGFVLGFDLLTVVSNETFSGACSSIGFKF